jgi:hypothetical protein
VNLAGATVTIYNGVVVNGTYSNCYPTYDGYTVSLVKSGSGYMYFSRYVDNGYDLQESGGTPWTNGGLQGSYTWSTVPTAPASITVTASQLNVTVTAGASASDGGQGISSYSVQYRTSTDKGSTWGAWGNTQTLSSLSYTYTNMAANGYYQFRVYSNNTNGSSAARSGTTVFISAGGKVWNGSAWAPRALKVWTGSAWQVAKRKFWNGSSWQIMK